MLRFVGVLKATAVVSLVLSTTAMAAGPAASGWSIQPTPNPAHGHTTFLQGVSCTAPTACTAVGYSISNSGPVVTNLAERWNGSAWSIQPVPNPSGVTISSLAAVSCTSATVCTAVGDYFTNSNTQLTLAERWNGTVWSIQPTPSPTGAARSALTGVSCTAATACSAVGSSTKVAGGHPVTLAERWNGTTWSIQPTPPPPGGHDSSLRAVACAAANACTAVGNYFNSLRTQVTLAERWNGTGWAIQPTPTNLTTHLSALFAVACPNTAACTAVGSYINTARQEVPLAERWNGTAWTVQPMPHLTAANFLSGVACPTAAACTAVGNYLDNSGTQVTLAEAWNGSAWAIQPTPEPSRATGSALLAVDCTAASSCTAVGDFSRSSPPGLTTRTLAERFSG